MPFSRVPSRYTFRLFRRNITSIPGRCGRRSRMARKRLYSVIRRIPPARCIPVRSSPRLPPWRRSGGALAESGRRRVGAAGYLLRVARPRHRCCRGFRVKFFPRRGAPVYSLLFCEEARDARCRARTARGASRFIDLTHGSGKREFICARRLQAVDSRNTFGSMLISC